MSESHWLGVACTLILGAGIMTGAPLWKAIVPEGSESLWYLVEATADETSPPRHKVKLVFRVNGDVLSGAVVSTRNDREFPLDALTFDGTILSFKMTSSDGTVAPYPLVLSMIGDKLEGYWMKSATEIAVNRKLKLIRAPQ